MQKTLLLSHPAFLNHGYPDHPENSTRLNAILEAIEKSPYSSLLQLQEERLATVEELCRVHTSQYVEQVLALKGKTSELDGETPITPGSVHAAQLAVGLALSLVERVIRQEVQNGFLFPRPPGHHARPGQGMGFCVFNTIALAAHHALSLGLKRILILDWDVHHGNGTQEAFYQDDRVLFIDLHQENLFPQNSGQLDERGFGKGAGFTINLPLPHSCRDDDYSFILDCLVKPIALSYRPELILISAGFDAHERDPLGSMSLSSRGYHLFTQKMKTLAEDICQGKMILFLEGGYQPRDLAENVIQCIGALQSAEGTQTTPVVQGYSEEVTMFIHNFMENYVSLFS